MVSACSGILASQHGQVSQQENSNQNSVQNPPEDSEPSNQKGDKTDDTENKNDVTDESDNNRIIV